MHEFERAWSDWLGVRHSVMVTSGTTANFALMAVVQERLGRRPRVGVSAVTWATNLTPSLLLGHEVTVFDVSPRTLGVDEESVCAAMEARHLDVLFVTHLLGFDALSDRVLTTARETGTIIVEDCCEAHGAFHGARRVGSIGLAGTFSFYFGHHMSTIEGGMISTDDEELADRLRLMRAHGLARESNRYAELVADIDFDPRFLFVQVGLNFRSSEPNAFLGLRQLTGLEERIATRNANLTRFLADAPSSIWTDFRLDGASSFALPLIARDAGTHQRVRRIVNELGVESRPVVAGNLLRQPAFASADLRIAKGGTPVADHIHEFGIYVGNGHHVTERMVDSLTARLQEGSSR